MHMSFKCSGMIKCYCIFRFLQNESTRKYITTLPTEHTWSLMSGCMFSYMLLKQFHLSWSKIFYFQSNSNDIYGIVLNMIQHRPVTNGDSPLPEAVMIEIAGVLGERYSIKSLKRTCHVILPIKLVLFLYWYFIWHHHLDGVSVLTVV